MRARGAFFTVLSAILSGVTPAFAKLIYADGVNTVTLVFFRRLYRTLIAPLPANGGAPVHDDSDDDPIGE